IRRQFLHLMPQIVVPLTDAAKPIEIRQRPQAFVGSPAKRAEPAVVPDPVGRDARDERRRHVARVLEAAEQRVGRALASAGTDLRMPVAEYRDSHAPTRESTPI